MEITILIVSVISAIAASLAARYARRSWLTPVPDLEFINGRARFIRANDGRYVLEVDVTVRNTGIVSAYIEDIKINGVSLGEKETISIDIWDVWKVKINTFVEEPGDHDIFLSPKRTFDRDKALGLRIKVATAIKPKRAVVKINTSKRCFTHRIKAVSEDSDPTRWS